METNEASSNLAKIAFLLANQPRSDAQLDTSPSTLATAVQGSLTADELAALKTFLSENHSLANLLFNHETAQIENDWWGS